MTPDYLAVQPDWTVADALQHIRERGREDETANTVFVVDDGWRLLDALPLQWFVLSDPHSTVRDVMDDQFVSLDAHTDREEAVAKMRRYGQVALPVVDSGGVLIGLVTIDDVLGVADVETTEDFHLTSAVAPVREGYWEATVGLLFRRRIGWLVGLVLVNLVSSGVIAAYEEMLVTYVALAFFIPLLIDTGGNAGAQSATIMIRAISLGEVRASQWGRAFLKEASLGLMIGATLGVLGLVLGIFRGGFAIGLIVMITMIVMLLLTNLLGVVLPFIFMRLGRDPAVAP